MDAGRMFASGGMPEAVVTDLVEPPGQYVLQEPAHEFVSAQVRVPPPPRAAMLVPDGDAVVVEADDTGVGDGDAKHIARQIAQHGLGTLIPRGAVHDPGLRPDRIWHDQVRAVVRKRASKHWSCQT